MCSADSSDHEAPHGATSPPVKVCPDSQEHFSSSSSVPTAHRHCIIVDSGATFHATGDLGVLSLDADKQSSARDRGAAGDCAANFHRRDGTVLPVAGVGTVEARDKNVLVPGVRYVPKLDPGLTLVSVQQLSASGFLVLFCGAFCYVTDVDNGGSIVGKGSLSDDDGFYHLDFLRVPQYATTTTVEDGKQMGCAAA